VRVIAPNSEEAKRIRDGASDGFLPRGVQGRNLRTDAPFSPCFSGNFGCGESPEQKHCVPNGVP
jgi:hypothetical protein